MAAVIKSPCNQHHPVGQQGRRVRSPRIVEATGDRPTPAVRVRCCFDIEGSFADIPLTSLSQREGYHLDCEKQQDDENPAPTEIRDDGYGPLLFHFVLSLILNRF
jgi:hypothetical protein